MFQDIRLIFAYKGYIFLAQQLAEVVAALNSWILHQKTTEAIQLFFAIGPTGQVSDLPAVMHCGFAHRAYSLRF